MHREEITSDNNTSFLTYYQIRIFHDTFRPRTIKVRPKSLELAEQFAKDALETHGYKRAHIERVTPVVRIWANE